MTRAVRLVARLAVCCLFAVQLGCAGTPSTKTPDPGVWRGGVVDLRGDWNLYTDLTSDPGGDSSGDSSGARDGEPHDDATPATPATPADLPAPDTLDWSTQKVPAPFDLGLPPQPEGVVTWWHREVRLDRPSGELRPALGVTVGMVNSAYDLWVGPRDAAVRLGGIGSPPPDPQVDYDRHATWPVPAHLVTGDSLHLWLRVWTAPAFGDGSGPHEGPFRFGELQRLVRDASTSELPQLFLSIFFVLLGLFHLELFRRRREERGYLWLAVVAILFGAYAFLRTQWKYTLGDLPFWWLKETEHAVIFVQLAAFVQLIWTLLGLRRGRWVRTAQALSLLFAAAVIVVPWRGLNGHLLVIWQGMLLLLVGRGLYLVLREAWQRNPDAHLVTIGAVLGAASFVHDVLVDREVLETQRLTWFGFAIFVLFLAATLAEQFARKLREIEDLRRSEEAAERANRAKSQFLANVSHEIRTPMTAILGGTELLMRRELPPEAQERVEVIRRSAADLLHVIDDILDVSKIEAGKMDLRPEDFRPAQLVEGILALFQPDVRRRGLLLRAEVPDRVPPKLRADAGRLRQILLNLISNAVKFTEKGSITVRLDYALVSSSRGELEISVADTGVGIDPEVLPRLFEPFSQADGSNSRRVGGTGLGLTISRRLAELMGGRLEVASRPGVGSTFTLTLPVEGSDAASAEVLLRDLRPAAGRQRRILLAEDNEVNRLIVTEQVRHLGFEVETAENGVEVLDRLALESADPVDLVLMDCQMPDLDGYETTRRIRQRESASGGPRLPIVALTAHAFEGERERCLEAGMDDYLSKPFRLGDLHGLLEHWLPP